MKNRFQSLPFKCNLHRYNEGSRAGPAIAEASVNYHRNKLASNSYLSSVWRASMPPLSVVQPEAGLSTQNGCYRTVVTERLLQNGCYRTVVTERLLQL